LGGASLLERSDIMSLTGTAESNLLLKGKLTAIPGIDRTLTKEGACAESKATGDAIAGLRDEASKALDAHKNNKNNPHGVTASQVGARPNTWMPTASEVGAVPAIESTDHPGCYYRMVGGETEWINPPMTIGEEYRTTERWNGYAVYTKLIDLGTVPVGERDYDIGFYSGLIRHYAVTGTNRSVLTTGEIVGEWDVSVKIFQRTARVTGGEGIGNNNETLYLQVWYTKP
jgi:hypothetical protein